MTDTALVPLPTLVLEKYEAAKLALAEAHRADEAKQIRDKAIALAAYAKQAKDRDMVMMATEIKLRAERRCGELLIEAKETGQRQTPGGDRKSSSSLHEDDRLPTLVDLRITPDQSSQWQQLAKLDGRIFERRLAKASDPRVLTTMRILHPRPVKFRVTRSRPSSRRERGSCQRPCCKLTDSVEAAFYGFFPELKSKAQLGAVAAYAMQLLATLSDSADEAVHQWKDRGRGNQSAYDRLAHRHLDRAIGYLLAMRQALRFEGPVPAWTPPPADTIPPTTFEAWSPQEGQSA
jgi:hypothetical protein